MKKRKIKMFLEYYSNEYPENYLKVDIEEIKIGNILKYKENSIRILNVIGKGIGSVVICEYLDGSKKGQKDSISVKDLRNK
jgi:hypothetical protein